MGVWNGLLLARKAQMIVQWFHCESPQSPDAVYTAKQELSKLACPG
jgi:hypothetical protein